MFIFEAPVFYLSLGQSNIYALSLFTFLEVKNEAINLGFIKIIW